MNAKPFGKQLITAAMFLLSLAALISVCMFGGQKALQWWQITQMNRSVRFGSYDAEAETIAKEDQEQVLLKTLQSYESPYNAVSSQYYRKVLEERESDGFLIYQAVLYALDHGYSSISLPQSLCEEALLKKSVYYAVFDQPMLEENSLTTFMSGALRVGTQELPRYFVVLPLNDEEHLAYKKQALEAAKEIVAQMPSEVSGDYKKAAYLYDWLVERVRYTEEADYNGRRPHYLYDALITQVTNCDGFSNAYTLLMNLAGVECFNVSGKVDPQDTVGHSWNIFRLGQDFYQADPTGDAGYFETSGYSLRLFFCLSASEMGYTLQGDWMQEDTPPCADLSHDLDLADVQVQSALTTYLEQGAIRDQVEALREGKPYFVLYSPVLSLTDKEANYRLIERWLSGYNETMTLIGDRKFCAVFLGKTIKHAQ